MIAFDLETHLIQPGLLAPPIVCGSFALDFWEKLTLRDEALDLVEDVLRGDKLLVGANIAYDMGCLLAARPRLAGAIFAKYERGEIFDIQIAQALDFIAKGYLRDGMIIDPRTGGPLKDPSTGKQTNRFSLATCVDLVLGRKDAKANAEYRLRYAELDGLPLEVWPEEAKQYPKDDARNTWDVAAAQRKTHENLHCMAEQAYAAFVLHLASIWGLRTDPDRVKALEEKLGAEHAKQQQRFIEVGLLRIDGSKDTKKLAQMVSDAYLGDPPKTPTGRVATDRDTLSESGDDLLEDFGGATNTAKLITTYLPFVQSGTDKPINLKANVLLASGRTSYDGLIQLLPRKGGIRECFRARPGYVYCSVDYAALELSTLAEVNLELVGFSRLAEAINDDRDCHSLFASGMNGKDYDEVLKLVETERYWKDQRQMAKAANFGFGGMMGAAKFALAKRKDPVETVGPDGTTYKGLRLCITGAGASICGVDKITEWKGRECPPVCRACVEQAERLRNDWLRMWPEMRSYFDYIVRTLDLNGESLIQLGDGMKRGGLNASSGANTHFQHLAAVGAKRALVAVSRECYLDRTSPLFGSRIVVFAHDEIITELREDQAHEAAYRQADLMIEAMRTCTPRVKVKAEPALMRYWYKDAKAVFDDKGRLVPWEPK
jgi:DNA polymerase I